MRPCVINLTLCKTAVRRVLCVCVQVHEQLLLSMLRVEDVKDRKVLQLLELVEHVQQLVHYYWQLQLSTLL
jgi:hypothetical protein